MQNLTVKNREADLETGFFFVEFTNGQSLQCCLKSLSQTEEEHFANGTIYLNQIEVGNSGHSEGICSDVNAWAAGDDDADAWDSVELFLIEQARIAGVEVVA